MLQGPDYGAVSQALGSLGDVFQQRREQEQKQQGLQGILSAMQQPEQDVSSLAAALQQSGVPPEMAIPYLQQAQQRQQQTSLAEQKEAQRQREAQEKYNQKQKEIERKEAFDREMQERKFELQEKYKSEAKSPQTIVEKKIDEFKANSIIDSISGDSAFKSNLDFLEENIKKVGMKKSILGVEYGFAKSKIFKEYENAGNLVLDGVIKIFNKAGTLPQKKLEWIKDTFAISPSDTQQQIKGKLSSLRRLENVSSEFNEKIKDLTAEYGVNIPNDVFIERMSSVKNELDSFAKENGFKDEKEVKKFDKLPPAKDFKGETFRQNGVRMKSDGEKWTKIK